MTSGKTDLNSFNNSWYKPGKSIFVRWIWFFVNAAVFRNPAFPFVGFKRGMLRLFGAKIGTGVIIKPSVNIKYPWKLEVGDYSWIGEDSWIDNLDTVTIGKNVCISQGALILSGNHDYKSSKFDLILKPIVIEDGVWIGAKATVTQGALCRNHSVLGVMSHCSGEMEAYGIYKGIPAVKVRNREINGD